MRLVFAGTPAFAAHALARLVDAGHEVALVLTQPDRPAGRGQHAAASAVKTLAQGLGLPVSQPVTLRAPETVAQICSAKPGALVVAAYGLILPQQVLDIAPHGAINIHASLLPRWRGAAPIQRALLAGDQRTGVSIMQMDAGLDTGPLLAQQAIAIAPDEDAETLHDKLARLGAEMIVSVLQDVAAGRARPRPQPSEGVTYAPKIDKRETIIDWSRPAIEVERAVRAFHPAATALQGESIRIWRASAVPGSGSPGAVLDPLKLVVACGMGALRIDELQRAGGRRLPAAEFLRGRPLGADARFG